MKIGLYSISCSGTWFRDRPALTVEEFVDTAKKYGYSVQSVMYQKFFEVAK